MVTRPILVNRQALVIENKVEEDKEIDISLQCKYSHEEIWKIYDGLKQSKPEDFVDPKNKFCNVNQNASIDDEKLRHLEYITAFSILRQVLSGDCKLDVISLVWNYHINNCPKNSDSNYKLKNVLNDAGSLENIPHHTLKHFRKYNSYSDIISCYEDDYESYSDDDYLECSKFYKSIEFLGLTTISFTLDNGSEFGLQYSLPFSYLTNNSVFSVQKSFLENCMISNSPYTQEANTPNSLDIHKLNYYGLKHLVNEGFKNYLCVIVKD